MANPAQNRPDPLPGSAQNGAERRRKGLKIAEIAQNGADQGRFLAKIQAELVELCGKNL